ncbi:MAG: GatB/YqeY domain-containing protein [Rhizomicrobium sp.]|jgi:protein-disulfide isomerase
MALRDLLSDALKSTQPGNERRLATLREIQTAIDAHEGATDADIQAIISRIIAEREQKAATFSAAGQTEMAKTERGEIDALRVFLRSAAPQAAAPVKKAKPAAMAEPPKTGGPLFSRTQMIIAGAAVGILAIVAILYFFVFNSGSDNEITLANAQNTAIQLYKDDRTLGSPTARITMLEYAAPSCPHCAHFDETVFPLIKQNYIDTGKVFYIFRTFPLNPSDGAAEAIARCLPADKYFWFIDLLFRNQKTWDPEYGITDVRGGLIQVARIAGMAVEKVDQCIADKNEQDRINQVAQDGETKYNIQGTPTFIINGEVMQAEEATWPTLQAKFNSLLSKH